MQGSLGDLQLLEGGHGGGGAPARRDGGKRPHSLLWPMLGAAKFGPEPGLSKHRGQTCGEMGNLWGVNVGNG